jgi:hypothetical protein
VLTIWLLKAQDVATIIYDPLVNDFEITGDLNTYNAEYGDGAYEVVTTSSEVEKPASLLTK